MEYCEIFEKLTKLLSIEYNCSPDDFFKNENTVTVSDLKKGGRYASEESRFFHMATIGNGAVITADEKLQSFLKEFSKSTSGYRLFETENLILNKELKKYGYTLSYAGHFFLPKFSCKPNLPKGAFKTEWVKDFSEFYGDNRFTHAIAYPEPRSYQPDVLGICAFCGNDIAGMAACSEDAPNWFQIGIDVIPEYRRKGLGEYLVGCLKNKILENGGFPFYCVSRANIRSINLAINCGFRPAWTELYSREEKSCAK